MCSSRVLLPRRYGPKPLTNVFSTLLNLYHEKSRQFWGKSRFNKVYLMKWVDMDYNNIQRVWLLLQETQLFQMFVYKTTRWNNINRGETEQGVVWLLCAVKCLIRGVTIYMFVECFCQHTNWKQLLFTVLHFHHYASTLYLLNSTLTGMLFILAQYDFQVAEHETHLKLPY